MTPETTTPIGKDGRSLEANYESTHMKTISTTPRIQPASTLLDMSILAFLEAGSHGLRQEAVYPPGGIQLQTTGQTYTDGNLRNRASDFKVKHDIIIAKKVDPYISQDGRSTQYKRYSLASIEQARAAINLFNHRRKAKGEEPLPQHAISRLLSAFASCNAEDFERQEDETV